MEAVDRYSAKWAATPGGADWLHVQHVPVRRFVAEIVRKLLALNSWAPFASAPGPLIRPPTKVSWDCVRAARGSTWPTP
ncbi:hypothetical protein LV779_02960 [Streptomyces thinghirensis]|nr:hypothetical protein [Streptomyces thinghirensis]